MMRHFNPEDPEFDQDESDDFLAILAALVMILFIGIGLLSWFVVLFVK